MKKHNLFIGCLLLCLIILAACQSTIPEQKPTAVNFTPILPTRLTPQSVELTSAYPAPTEVTPDNPYPGAPIPSPASPYPAPTESKLTSPDESQLTPAPTLVQTIPTFPGELVGLRLIFKRQDNLWTWQGGTEQKLTSLTPDTNQARLSGDGKLVAFNRQGSVWIVQSDGRGEKALISLEDFAQLPPKEPGVVFYSLGWLPNSHKLLFNTLINDPQGMRPTNDLFIADADNGKYEALLPAGEGGQFYASPDGKWIAVVSPTQLRIINPQGGQARVLLELSQTNQKNSFEGALVMRWGQDGDHLVAVVRPGDLHKDPAQIWSIALDGSAPILINTYPLAPGRYFDLSPDLLRLAYYHQTDPTQPEALALHISNLDGSQDFLLIARTGVGLDCWTPESQNIVIWSKTDGYQLYSLDGKLRPLTDQYLSNSGILWLDSAHFLMENQVWKEGKPTSLVEIRLGFTGQTSLPLVKPEAGLRYFDYSLTGIK